MLTIFGPNQKSPKISTNTYRTKLSLCQLHSVGEPLQLGYKSETWPILKKKFWKKDNGAYSIFLSHMEIWAENSMSE